MMHNEFNSNTPYKQFAGLDDVLVLTDDNGSKVLAKDKDKGDVIDWMTKHSKDERALSTSYADIAHHHGKINVRDAKDDLFEYAYLKVEVDVKRGSKLNAISKAIADFGEQWRSITVTKKETGPLVFGEVILVVKLDRRMRTQIVRGANVELAEKLKKYLVKESTKLDASRHKVFYMDDLKINELSEHYSEAKFIDNGVNGCCDGDYVVSSSKDVYIPSTDDVMTWLESIPYDALADKDWKKRLHRHTVTTGYDKKTHEPIRESKPNKNSRPNANLILVNRLTGLFKYNDTRQLPVVTRKLVDRRNALVIKQGVLDKPQITAITLWLESQPNMAIKLPQKEVESLILGIADRNHYDSFFDYLAALPKWDGKKRLLKMFTTSLGVKDTPMTRYLSLIVTVGMIHMAKYPGDKMDFVLDLVGKQGLGKTTLIQKLSNSFGTKKKKVEKYGWYRPNRGWYTQGFTSITDKDAMLQFAGKLYVNDDEMVASEKSTEAELKEFATADQLEFRPPYGKTMKAVDRRYLMWRTTNKLDVYISKLGQRKYWPMIVGQAPITTPVVGEDSVWTPDFVDQLWSEAVHIYETKGDTWVSKLTKMSEDKRWAKYRDLTHADLQHTDDETITVVGYIADKMAELKPGQKLRVATQQILDETGLGGDIKNQKLTHKIANIMQNDLAFSRTRVAYKDGKPAGYRSTDKSAEAVKQAVVNFKAAFDDADDDSVQDVAQNDDDDIFASLDQL